MAGCVSVGRGGPPIELYKITLTSMGRIIIIDDDPSIVGLLNDLLAADGHELTTYQSSVEALRILKDPRYKRPQLILLDVMMPEIDGFTLLSKLSEDKRTRSIPVIVMTARGQLADVFVQYPAVKAFIAKPFDLRGIRDKVKQALGEAK